MSSSIWTRCGASSNLRPLLLKPWRAVETQHLLSSRKLVDSLQEQEALDRLLEDSARSAVPGPEAEGFHDLLIAPFRQPPLAHGSRFGGRHEPSLWYGSESLRTAFAEVSYYRLLFLAGTTADLGQVIVELTTFRASVHTERGVDLTQPPFDARRDVLASRTDYTATQALGSAMRSDGVEALRYPSARDAEGGVNVGVMSVRAFAARRPRELKAWTCVAVRTGVEVSLKDPLSERSFFYPRRDFEVGGVLPAPAI